MHTYYELFNITPKASAAEVEMVFRRYVARYRPTLTAGELLGDVRLHRYLNAYLTLSGPGRAAYDARMKGGGTPPTPFADLSPRDRQFLTARIAVWRRETVEALHLLRGVLEKEPGFAPGWALIGEVYFTLDRLEEGIKAYQRAVQAAPDQPAYADRLRHAEQAATGRVALRLALSPEEELLREERRKRGGIMLLILLVGAAVMAASVLLPVRPNTGALQVPWRTVGIQAVAVGVLMLGLGYGRMVQPFERVMLWNTVMAGDRGSVRHYPYGLLFLVTSVASLWLAVLTLIASAFMDEEWPTSPLLLLLCCILANVGLAVFLHHGARPWGSTLLLGGNPLVIAGMIGWWIGSLGAVSYD